MRSSGSNTLFRASNEILDIRLHVGLFDKPNLKLHRSEYGWERSFNVLVIDIPQCLWNRR